MHEWSNRLQNLAALNKLMSQIACLPCYHVHGSFGDVYMQLSMLKESAECGNEFSILIDPVYETLVRIALKSTNTRVVWVNSASLNQVLNTLSINGNIEQLPVRLLPTVHPLIPELMQSGNLRYQDFTRYMTKSQKKGALAVVEDEQCMNSAIQILKKSSIPLGSSLIISLNNNSQQDVPSNIIDFIIESALACGLTPVINTAKTFNATSEVKQYTRQLVPLDVPNWCPVSICQAAGFYIGGTNGFQTIQALFNPSPGVHIINASKMVDGMIADKSGTNFIPLGLFRHQAMFSGSFLGIQREIVLNTEEDAITIAKIIKLFGEIARRY